MVSSPVQNVFSTPLLVTRGFGQDGLNDALRAFILDLREQTPNSQRSNIHGWESGLDFHAHADPCVQQLKSHLHRHFFQISSQFAGAAVEQVQMRFTESALANVACKGAYHAPHIHRGCSWSAVYYVAAAKDSRGELELLDPRTNPVIPGISRRKNAVLVKPEPGLTVVFPGWLEHWVHPWDSNEDRISVAWNITIQDFGLRAERAGEQSQG